jgi:hypothetical protein
MEGGRPPACSVTLRLRATQPSENLAPRAKSTYNNNEPIEDISELTKNLLPMAPLSVPPLFKCSLNVSLCCSYSGSNFSITH